MYDVQGLSYFGESGGLSSNGSGKIGGITPLMSIFNYELMISCMQPLFKLFLQ